MIFKLKLCNKINLGNYFLWPDGFVEINPIYLEDLFLQGINPNKISVTEINADILKYNALATNKILTKTEIDENLIKFDWQIPKNYLDINIDNHILKILNSKTNLSKEDFELRLDRVNKELSEYKKNNIIDILKVLIYTIDIFKTNNIVWGVGRGSSCASYILFLLEVHSIDPIKYNIPLSEFFK
jgi:DNA polymerase III alpha subunit